MRKPIIVGVRSVAQFRQRTLALASGSSVVIVVNALKIVLNTIITTMEKIT